MVLRQGREGAPEDEATELSLRQQPIEVLLRFRGVGVKGLRFRGFRA